MRDLFEVERVVAPCSPAGEILTANAGGKVIIGIGIHVAKIKLQKGISKPDGRQIAQNRPGIVQFAIHETQLHLLQLNTVLTLWQVLIL